MLKCFNPKETPISIVNDVVKSGLPGIQRRGMRVGAKAGGAGTLGHSARVRTGQTDGRDRAVDNIQALEAGGG